MFKLIKRFYVRYNIIIDHVKIGWGEEVKADSKLDAKHFIEHKYEGNNSLKILNITELH